MSRCFPFPPPGYEKKAQPDDESLLAKEKHKEKKSKKDKKRKERNEGKDRDRKNREKIDERSREFKDKKDKKEKHKDNKETKRTSDEKLGLNYIGNDESNESRFVVELEKRSRDDKQATENHIGILFEGNGKFKDKQDGHLDNNKARQNGKECGVTTFIRDNERSDCVETMVEEQEKEKAKNGDSKEKRRKSKDGEKKSKSKEKKKEKEEKTKEKKLVGVNMVKPTNPVKEIKNALDPAVVNFIKSPNPLKEIKNALNLAGVNMVAANPVKEIKNTSLSAQVNIAKPTNPSKEINSASDCGGILGKRKDLQRNGFHDSGIRPNKLTKPVSYLHEVVENGMGTKSLNNHMVDNTILSLPENRTKTKSLENPEANIKVLPSHLVKLQQHQNLGVIGNHMLDISVPLEKGRQLEVWEMPGKLGAITKKEKGSSIINKEHEVNGSVETEQAKVKSNLVINKEHEINGLIEVQPAKFNEKAKASKKAPHPDVKYLRQILMVPTVEFSDFDEQEWLFGCYDFRIKKLSLDSERFEDQADQVWAEAFRVNSADVTVMPYVIPY